MTDGLDPLKEILVTTDFSEGSIAALRYALKIAAASGARLHLLHVDDDPILMQATTDQSFRDARHAELAIGFKDLLTEEEYERFGVVKAIRSGTAYHEIEEYAAENGIELIVMGNLGRSAIADVLLGSVTAHVIRHASCPVLSVKTG